MATVVDARALPVGIAIALAVPAALTRTLYWRVLLTPVQPVRFRLLLGYTIACNAANVLLPARAGDAMRAWLLRNRHGVPLSVSGAVVVIEKVCDLLALAVLVLPLPWLLRDLPPIVADALAIVLAIVVGVTLLLLIVTRLSARSPWLTRLEAVRRPGALLRGFGAVLLYWLVDVSLILLVMSAVGLGPRIESALLILLFVTLATAIPLSPGQLGTHEIASAAALRLQGALPEQAVAFSLLYHCAQLLPALLMGLFDLRTMFAWQRTAAARA